MRQTDIVMKMGVQQNHWRFLLAGVTVSLVLAVGSYVFLQHETQKDIRRIQGIYANRIESSINAVFHKTDVLAAVIKLQQGHLSEKTFMEIAKLIYVKDAGIRGIQYMPGAVVTYSYPLKGNEGVMGKNFFQIPERRKDVQLAIDTRSIALSGPYHLIQGGLGVVARNPVFLTNAKGKEYFWGFSTLVLDLPDALSPVGLNRMTADGYDFQLFCVNENQERLVLAGNPDMKIETAISGEIKVPHHQWILAVKESNPWRNIFKAGGIFLAGILCTIILWLRYRMRAQKREAMQIKARFFSDISHDMRTPLNAILGFASLGRTTGLSVKEKDDYLEKIQIAGNLLLELVNDTLTLSKAGSGQFHLSFAPVAREELYLPVMASIQMMADKKNLILQLDDVACPAGMVMTSALNVRKILLNLLNNAVKYTPPGGHITLTVRAEVLENESCLMTFIVQDDGIGIGSDFLPHIFEPFVQEQRQGFEGIGTGLGLAIVKQIVDLLKGTLAVESTLGQGTTFRVALPVRTVASTADISEKTIRELSGQLLGRKVLVCEDNEMNREIICTLLENQGLFVDAAENGQSGVERFAQSMPGEYLAIFMDLRMPVLDGYAATRRIRAMAREDAKKVPILALTADVFDDVTKNVAASGMNGCLAKPIDMKILLQTLASFAASADA